MSALPGLTYSSPGVPLYQPFGSSSGSQSTVNFANTYTWNGSTIQANSIEFDLSAPSTSKIIIGAEGTLFAQLEVDGGTGNLTLNTPGVVAIPTSLDASTISTGVLGAHLIDCDSISTAQIDLDGQLLTANATELLLNGIPLATLSNLSSIADWSLDPAISTVQMAGNNLVGVGAGFFSTLQTESMSVSSLSASTISAISGVFQDISTYTLTVQSTIHAISTISSSVLEAEVGNFSTLVAGNMSTPALFVSSINGAEFTSTSINVQVAGVSSLVANSISSVGAVLQEALVSTLQFNPSFSPNLDVNLGLGSLFGNLVGAASGGLSLAVSGAALGTGIAALAQGRQTSNINSNSYELVNGTTQLQISTLGIPFSTVYRFVSSVSETTPGEEFFISTIYPPGQAIRSLSDPLNTVSSPTSTIQSFGQWVSLPEAPAVSSISSFNALTTSTLYISGGGSGYGVREGAPFLNGGSGISTIEFFTQDAPQYSGSARVNQINFSFAGLTSNNFADDVIVYNYSGNSVPPRLAVNTGGAQIAYLSDIPAPSGAVSSFSTINIGVDGAINMLDGEAHIYLGTGGNNFGELVSGVNPSLILDGATSEVSVPLGNFDVIGAKINAVIEITSPISTQSLLVSSINGSAYPPPAAPTISTFQEAFISSATISSVNGGQVYTTANPPPAADASTIAVSSITSIGSVSSIVIAPNASSFMSMTTVGDVDFVVRDFFAQATTAGVPKATLNVASSGAGGNGVWQLTTPFGTGTLGASTISISTNQMRVSNISTAAITVSSINNQQVALPFSGGQFYRSTNQNLPTGNNTLIFDSAKPWNSLDFVQTDPSTFVCSTTGTYQIGVNTTILAATGTWTSLLKTLIVSQDRGGALSVVVNSTSIPSPQNYGQSASALIDINQGDNLRFITGQTLATGSTIALGLASVFDYNTFWDYQRLR